MPERPAGSEERRRSGAFSPWYIVLLIPFIAMLWVPFYASAEPSWQGIPFFYWYQFLWILLSAGLTALVYLATRSRPSR